jgi:hypothetical protein
VQSLDGEIRKWLWGLPPASIADIEALDESFIKQREIGEIISTTSLSLGI